MKHTEVSPHFYEIYNRSLRLHAHLLLAWGHKQAKSQFSTEDEEEISDVLYQNIHLLLMEQKKRWMANYAVKNEDPISGVKRTGKNRREIDLIIEFTGQRRPQYVFEAKVLNWGKSHQRTGNYTNQSGMGRFMEGEYADYTSRFPEIAMIGYVLSDSLEFWQEKLKAAIDDKQMDLKLCQLQEDVIICEEIQFEWVSQHERSSSKSPIKIHHILLDCG